MKKLKNETKIETSQKQIIDKASFILSKKINELNDRDKTLQQFINFILKDGFSTTYFKIPININTDKNSLNCLKYYVEIIYEIFQLKTEKREFIYSSDLSTAKIINDTIPIKFEEFMFIFRKIKKDFTNEYSEDKKAIYLKLKNALMKKKGIFSILELYQIYFCSLCSKPDILQFIFFQMHKNMYINYYVNINYKNYAPNFNNQICLKLILLYLEELEKRNEEFLYIYIDLIFHFNWYFNKKYNESINKDYIRTAIKKTHLKIEQKNLKSRLNLTGTIGSIFLSYLLVEFNIPKNIFNIKNIDEISNYYLKDEIKKLENKDIKNNNSTEPSEKSNNNNNKNNNNDIITEKKMDINNIKTDAKSVDELNQKINSIVSNYELRFAQNDLIIKELRNEKEKDKKKILENEQKILENKNKINELQEEIEIINSKLNNIMLRDKLKNFLNTFGGEFNQLEKEIIANDRTKRGEVALSAFRKKFFNCRGKERFVMIQEFIEKVGKIYNRGNFFAHNIDLSKYQKEISLFKAQNNINFVVNDDIIVLLKLCEIPNENIIDLSKFMMICFDSDFNTRIEKGKNIIENYILNK